MASDGRVNLLLVGSDSRSSSGNDEKSLRTDSVILVSIESATGKTALFTFPRNLVNAPLDGVALDGAYEKDQFPGFLAYLWSTAAQSPDKFPGSEGVTGDECLARFDCTRGWRALAGTVQVMAGLQIDGLIAVNLNGFVALVNNLPAGGLWIDVPERVVDDLYYNSQRVLTPLDIAPGCQFMTGEVVLAYVRSRHQDSDFERTRRQQSVLQQLRSQVDPLALLPHLAGLTAVARENLFMTMGQSDLPPLIELASKVDATRLYRVIFDPNTVDALGGMGGIATKVNGIFDEPEPKAEPKPAEKTCPDK